MQNYYLDTMESFSVPADLIYDIDKNIISDRPNDGVCLQEIDFRYNGGASCLMLFLDGHVSQEDAWSTIWDLESFTASAQGGISASWTWTSGRLHLCCSPEGAPEAPSSGIPRPPWLESVPNSL